MKVEDAVKRITQLEEILGAFVPHLTAHQYFRIRQQSCQANSQAFVFSCPQ